MGNMHLYHYLDRMKMHALSCDSTSKPPHRRFSGEMVPKNWTTGLALDLISNARERIDDDEQDPPESWIGFQGESGAGGTEGRADGGGDRREARTSSDAGQRVETAAGRWGIVGLRERDRQGREERRGPGRRALQADRPAESGTGFFGTKARSLSRVERHPMIDRLNEKLSLTRQCQLLGLSRVIAHPLHDPVRV